MKNKPICSYNIDEYQQRSVSSYLKLISAYILVGFMIVFTPNIAYGQSQPANNSSQQAARKISGKVVEITGEPIVGATVMVSGTNAATITNIDGNFSLDIPANAKVLSISYMGFTTKDIDVSKQSNFNIILEEVSFDISEVVVVGYGSQKKESVLGAISQVGSEALVRSGNSNITNAIAGKLSGVLTIQQSGQPGQSGSEIIIRGLSSWNGSQPLVLVDGVERDFSNLDPNEINTVSVLKDASATAVFGAKGANGVIIVTTKRGVVGKPKLNLSYSTGFEIPTALPNHISSYTTMQMLNVGLMNKGGDNFQRLISEQVLNEYQNPSTRLNSLRYPDNNWFDMLAKPYAPSTQSNINISGGTKFVKYFASFGYLHEGDFFKGYNEGFADTRYKNDRINYRTNLDFKITNSTDISLNLGGDIQITNSHRDSPWKSLFGSSPAVYPAYFPAWVLDEVPDPDYPNATGVRYADKIGEFFDNPYSQFYNGSFRKHLTSKFFSDLLFNQKLDFITQGLSLKAKVSLSTSYRNLSLSSDYSFPQYRLDYDKIGQSGVNPWFRIGEGLEVYNIPPQRIWIGGMEGNYYTDLYYEFSTHYNRSFGNHNVTGLALINFQERNQNTDFGYYNAGVVARGTYDYSGKYLFEMNLGYTGSERFAPGNRFGFFPSVALGWVVSEEKFFEPLTSVMNKLKLRYSDGFVGSDRANDRWLYLSNYSISGDYIIEDRAANTVAQWEMARKRDLGLEMGFFKNKLRFNIDIYDEYRDRMLLAPNTVTFYVGNSFKELNLGKMKKQGFEFEVEYNNITATKIDYFIKANIGYNENRILYRDDLPYSEEYQKQAGKPLGGQLNGLELNGNQYFGSVDDLHINPSPVVITGANVGDYQYVDYNGDGVINIADRHPIQGSMYPPFTYSLSSGFSYKGFEFNFMLQGNAGKYVNFNGAFEYEFLKGNLRVHESQLDYWTPTNPNANHATLNFEFNNDPKFAWAGGSADEEGYRGMLNGRTWRNADYLRLKEVYVGYTFKSKSLNKTLGVNSVNVFATGNNLLTFTNLIQGDPERRDFTTGFYPQMINAKAGLKVSF